MTANDPPRKRRRAVTPDEICRVEEMIRAGTEHRDIASQTGLSASTIGRIATGQFQRSRERREKAKVCTRSVVCGTTVEARARAARAVRLRRGREAIEAAKEGD